MGRGQMGGSLPCAASVPLWRACGRPGARGRGRPSPHPRPLPRDCCRSARVCPSGPSTRWPAPGRLSPPRRREVHSYGVSRAGGWWQFRGRSGSCCPPAPEASPLKGSHPDDPILAGSRLRRPFLGAGLGQSMSCGGTQASPQPLSSQASGDQEAVQTLSTHTPGQSLRPWAHGHAPHGDGVSHQRPRGGRAGAGEKACSEPAAHRPQGQLAPGVWPPPALPGGGS